MNIKDLLWGLFLTQPVLSAISRQYLPISSKEKNTVVNMLNVDRNAAKASDMLQVRWNNTCTQRLEYLADKYGKDWFFEEMTNVTIMPGTFKVPLKAAYLDQFPEFSSVCPGFISLYRDTGKIRPDPISRWLKFRNTQKSCCNIPNCDHDNFTNYQSCCHSDLVNSRPCSWVFKYLPRNYISSMSEIAGIVLNRRGPYTPDPKNQNQVGILYAKMQHAKDMMYNTDGEPCSKCPPEAPKCVAACRSKQNCAPALCAPI